MFNGGTIGVVNIPKGDIKCGFRETGMGTGDKGRDVEKAGLEGVGGSDGADMVGVPLELEDRCKSQRAVDKISDSEKI